MSSPNRGSHQVSRKPSDPCCSTTSDLSTGVRLLTFRHFDLRWKHQMQENFTGYILLVRTPASKSSEAERCKQVPEHACVTQRTLPDSRARLSSPDPFLRLYVGRGCAGDPRAASASFSMRMGLRAHTSLFPWLGAPGCPPCQSTGAELGDSQGLPGGLSRPGGLVEGSAMPETAGHSIEAA